MDATALIAVMIGGAIGAGLRYAITLFFLQRFGPLVPYGTFAINVLGCFLVGVIIELARTRAFGITPIVRLFATVGILGGFTTFSAFAYESVALIEGGYALISALYVGASVVVGLLAAYAGSMLARMIVR
jgi:CrcB protein